MNGVADTSAANGLKIKNRLTTADTHSKTWNKTDVASETSENGSGIYLYAQAPGHIHYIILFDKNFAGENTYSSKIGRNIVFVYGSTVVAVDIVY